MITLLKITRWDDELSHNAKVKSTRVREGRI